LYRNREGTVKRRNNTQHNTKAQNSQIENKIQKSTIKIYTKYKTKQNNTIQRTHKIKIQKQSNTQKYKNTENTN
jgi:hypothetical protein